MNDTLNPTGERVIEDALEAATRQHSGDDREALIDVVKRNRSVVKRMSDGYPSVAFVADETIADAILAAGFSRAAVPDAATEEFESLIYPDYEGLAAAVFERSHEPAFSDDSRGLREARAFAESLVEMYIDQQGLKQLKAEREAALAAIERVRAAIRQYPNYGARFAVEAALDMAPESAGLPVDGEGE